MRFDYWQEQRERAKVLANGIRVLIKPSGERFILVMWMPKAKKPFVNEYHKSLDSCGKTSQQHTKRYDESQAQAKQYRDERKATQKVAVGTIFRNSWGYDQTNVDYYEVTANTEKTVTLREIASERAQDAETGNSMADYVRPVPGNYIGAPFVKRVSMWQGEPQVSFEHGGCSIVAVHRFGDMPPLVVEKSYRSWYA